MTTIERLEVWKTKGRVVNIYHDDGLGASPGWEVELISGERSITTLELEVPGGDELYSGLEATINFALDKWEAKE
jgi:hypothetical protein